MVGFVATTIATVPATGSAVWDWQYGASDITARGTFTVENPDASGAYLITAITGTRNGKTITGLQPTGTSIPGNEPFLVDNLVFLGSGPQLTSHGFGFSTEGGSFSNPFYADFLSTPGYLEFFSTPPEHSEPPIAFSAVPVSTPEPATVALVLMSGLFFCGLRWRGESSYSFRNPCQRP